MISISIVLLVIGIAFLITSDFFIHIMQVTLKVQTSIIFLLVNKYIKCGRHFLRK